MFVEDRLYQQSGLNFWWALSRISCRCFGPMISSRSWNFLFHSKT